MKKVYLKDAIALICNLLLLFLVIVPCVYFFLLFKNNIWVGISCALLFFICSIFLIIILLKYTTRKIVIKVDEIIEKNFFGKIINRVKINEIKKICIEKHIKAGKHIVLRDERKVDKICKTSYGEELGYQGKFINFRYSKSRLNAVKSYVNCEVQEYDVE